MAQGIVVKINKLNNYTVMSNQHFHVTNMSLRAKGLLSLILSLPTEWDFSIEGLASLSKDGYEATRSTLKELVELGYLKIIKQPPSEETGKHITYQYTFYESSTKKDKLNFIWKNNPEKVD